ncbi:arrestin domain-containing protein 3-like [Limulus polyphemus]|uniref:Arrestin domain-containing protein 3-like n=1 Tax=Limulus polyphemus TaxID=6850 RepID=A0ABM1T829_LIMPO|nr:arrestin domain-containing protein 3-like [Limulus polyphemus]
MGKLKAFEIVFDGNKTVFYPGQQVSGKCVVDLRGDMKMKSLCVFMRGVAKVHWTESRSTGNRLGAYTEHYNAEIEYFFMKQVLFGGESGEGREVLAEGHHEFPFSFQLPSGSSLMMTPVKNDNNAQCTSDIEQLPSVGVHDERLENLTGRRKVDMRLMEIHRLSAHTLQCIRGGRTLFINEQRFGLESNFHFRCRKCETKVVVQSDPARTQGEGNIKFSSVWGFMEQEVALHNKTRSFYCVKNLIDDLKNGPYVFGSHEKSVENGRQNEQNAILAYTTATGITVFVDVQNEFFGASPDGLIGGNGILEVKCPKTAKGVSTSFEGKYGSIRYWLKAEMEKPWSFNHKTKKAFTLISPIDINRTEYLMMVENTIEKTLCCWCCTSGPISLYARTDRKGYCPVMMLISNICIIQITLQIPGAYNLSMDLPVVIGTVPLRTRPPNYRTLQSNMENLPRTNEARLTFYPPAPPYSEVEMSSLPDEPPPMYAECVEGSVDITEDDDDIIGDTRFTPTYAYVHDYQYQPPPAYSEVDPNPAPVVEEGQG